MTHKSLSELWRTDREAAIKIIDAIDRGDPMELMDRCTQVWHPKSSRRDISLHTHYRLAPRDPIIDWSQIGAYIVAFAMDENGIWFAYHSEPFFNGETWVQISGYVPASYWPKAFTPGHNIPAEKSLRLRPKEGE